jgi:hypothetical protein
MLLEQRLAGPLTVLVLLLQPGCSKPTNGSGPQVPFADAEVFFELNTTANDLGLQIVLDAPGWKRVSVSDPRSSRVVQFTTDDSLSKLGITELRLESAEPPPAEVLALFPPGDYAFTGTTVEGQSLVGTATLAHDFLPAPTFSPSNGQVVDPNNVVVTWNAAGAERVEIIIENAGLGHLLDVIVSGSTTRLNVPPQFLTRGTEYKIEVLAIAKHRNRTLVESTFATRP